MAVELVCKLFRLILMSASSTVPREQHTGLQREQHWPEWVQSKVIKRISVLSLHFQLPVEQGSLCSSDLLEVLSQRSRSAGEGMRLLHTCSSCLGLAELGQEQASDSQEHAGGISSASTSPL